MSILKKITTILFILCITGVSNAYPEAWGQINFSYISINDGLSQSTVFSIAQDKLGNMWFATYDGVNKYDGYTFTVYQHDENDPNSIANDISRIVMTDSKGRVWIGTRDGLSYYDEEKDKFQNFFLEKNGKHLQVNGIVELSPERLLISTLEGLTMFDIPASRFVDDIFGTAMHKMVASALYRHDDQIYIGTPSDGLYCYSIPKNTLEKLAYIPGSKQIQSILQQSPTRIWVATEGSGLLLVNPKAREVKTYRHSPSDPQSISSNYIRSLALDSQNRLWIGTFNDLNIYHEGNDSFMSYSSNPVESGSLSQRSVRSIFMDSQGGMWLGTYFGGLNYYHPIRNRFKNIEHIPFKNSLSDNVASCIVEDKQKNLWIGTNDGGLNLYIPGTQKFIHYALQESQREDGLGSNNIKSVYVDEPRGLVYIGAHAGGLSILHRNSGRMENFNQLNSPLINENVYAILPDGENNFLLGTLSALVHFNPEKRSFTTITQENDGTPINVQKITTLFRDSKKRLWIGGEEGVSVFNQHGTSIQKADILPESTATKAFTNYIYEANNGLVWIGTREGFYCFDEKAKQIKRYTKADGLPNNVVYGILEDSYGRLWMSTNRGISCFNPKTEKFRNFTEADGLQSNQFNTSSCYRTSDGEMYFGGINGLTTFRPELLQDNPYTPPVVITKLQLFNKTVRPDDETGILSKNISDTESITLKSWQTAFSLEFVVSNYISGQHNTFAYKLDGYDKEWYYLTDRHPVSYSNLPQGTYHFMVKAANNDGKWNTTPTVLEIVILPVWYKTWWAVILFLATFAGFVTFVFRFFWMRKKMEAELEIERRDKEHREEINQMKMRFFINISHELRTPLTLILAPLQEVISKINDRWTRNQLEYIQRNANRLLHLVNQLMDYRRAELGVFELKIKKGNAYRLIRENFLYYDKLARHKEIHYAFHSDLEEKEELFDPNYLELIVNNLLSNAFKYTPSNGKVTLSAIVDEHKKCLEISVADTGIGIAKEKRGELFKRFMQSNFSSNSTGIGLHLTHELVNVHKGSITYDENQGGGSVFTVSLPTDTSVYEEKDFLIPHDAFLEEKAREESYEEENIPDVDIAEEKTPSNQYKLLIIEDDNDVREFLKEEFKPYFEVVTEADGLSGLERARTYDADLIICDVLMPGLTGFEVTRKLKNDFDTSHIPIILLTAMSSAENHLKGVESGADAYITKPFSPKLLLARAFQLIKQREKLRKKFSDDPGMITPAICTSEKDKQFADKLQAILEEQISNSEFAVDDLASVMGLGRSTFYRKVRGITGYSPNEYMRIIRMKKAAELLLENRYTVAEVSYKIGIEDPFYFSKCFKKQFGVSPSVYLRGKNDPEEKENDDKEELPGIFHLRIN